MKSGASALFFIFSSITQAYKDKKTQFDEKCSQSSVFTRLLLFSRFYGKSNPSGFFVEGRLDFMYNVFARKEMIDSLKDYKDGD